MLNVLLKNVYCKRIVLVVLFYASLFYGVNPAWAADGFFHAEQNEEAVLSPQLTINAVFLKQGVSDLVDENIAAQEYFYESTLNQYNSSKMEAGMLCRIHPSEAAGRLRDIYKDTYRQQYIWKILKKISPERISLILHQYVNLYGNIETADIISRFKPLKAALALKAMDKQESFELLNCLALDNPKQYEAIIKQTRPLNIAYAAIECASISKGGGLADVIDSLLQEAADQGDSPLLIMPSWGNRGGRPLGEFKTKIKNRYGEYKEETVRYFLIEKERYGVKYRIILLENKNYFETTEKYGGDHTQKIERFVLYNKAFLKVLEELPQKLGDQWKQTDTISCHEGHAALIPTYKKIWYDEKGMDNFKDTQVVFTTHNLILDEFVSDNYFWLTELENHSGYSDKMRVPDPDNEEPYYSFQRAAFNDADQSNTVSINFSEEVRKMDVIGGNFNRYRDIIEHLYEQGKWRGIPNGEDEGLIPHNIINAIPYTALSIERKKENKPIVQKLFGLAADSNAPMINMVGRISRQKGWYLLLPLIKQILDQGAQIVFVGGPEKTDQESLRTRAYFLVVQNLLEKQDRYKDKLGFSLEFSVEKARVSFTGADIGIVPSIYAPFEIVPVQNTAMGEVVVHSNCGGMKDTMEPVKEDNDGNIKGFAFGFDNIIPSEGKYNLLDTLEWYYHYYLDNHFSDNDSDQVLYGQNLEAMLRDENLKAILDKSFGKNSGDRTRENQALISAVFKVLNLYEHNPEKFPNVCALRDAAKSALDLYRDKSKFRQAQLNAMNADFSWQNSYYRYREEMYGQPADNLPAFSVPGGKESVPVKSAIPERTVLVESAV